MAVSVGDAEREVADGAMHRSLQRVIDGICLVFKAGDIAKALDRATEVGVVAASDAKVGESLACDGRSIGKFPVRGARVAISLSNGLTRGKGIVRGRDRKELVEVALLGQV